jgi:hypothetical protein
MCKIFSERYDLPNKWFFAQILKSLKDGRFNDFWLTHATL